MANEDNDVEICERLFPLIATWGTAIEEGRDADVPAALDALMKEFNDHPHDLKIALQNAAAFQSAMAENSPIPQNAPNHPNQRLARIHHIQGMLFAHPYEQS
ncbi:MAG: hypothetical protein AB8B83_07825 [Bdellovibrionales bacterium]